MNPELIHALPDKAKKRDMYFTNTQKLAGAATTALGLGITPLLIKNYEIDREFILECRKNYFIFTFWPINGKKSLLDPVSKEKYTAYSI